MKWFLAVNALVSCLALVAVTFLWVRSAPEALLRAIQRFQKESDLFKGRIEAADAARELKDAEQRAGIGALIERAEEVFDQVERKRARVQGIASRLKSAEEPPTPQTREEILADARQRARGLGML